MSIAYTTTGYTWDELPDKDARAVALAAIMRNRELDELGQSWAIETEIEHGAAGEIWRALAIEPRASRFVWSLFSQGSGAGPNELPIDDARPLLRAAGIDLRTATARRLIELAEGGRLYTRTKDRTPFLTEVVVEGAYEYYDPTTPALGFSVALTDRLDAVLRAANDRTERALTEMLVGELGEDRAIEDARERGPVFARTGDLLNLRGWEVAR